MFSPPFCVFESVTSTSPRCAAPRFVTWWYSYNIISSSHLVSAAVHRGVIPRDYYTKRPKQKRACALCRTGHSANTQRQLGSRENSKQLKGRSPRARVARHGVSLNKNNFAARHTHTHKRIYAHTSAARAGFAREERVTSS